VPRLSASLAYYTVFSMAPLFVLILMLIGQIFGPDAVRNELDTQLTSVMGRKAAEAVQGMIQSSMLAESRTLALVTGSITLLLGATGIFKELKAALNTIWEAAPPKDQPFVWSWSRTRLLSLGMVAVIMFMMIASMIISAGISFAARHLGEWFPIAPVVWVGAGLAAGLALETTLFALLFRVLPDVRLPTRDIWWGAAVTAVLFEGGKWVLGWYLGRESTLSAYGAAGSIMLVLLWVYYTSIILLTGAELTQVRSRMRGMHDNPSPIPAG
jgi:membrane protein